ncbi:MAG: hypothetical protein WD751_03880 [Anaerolineales bacterium]
MATELKRSKLIKLTAFHWGGMLLGAGILLALDQMGVLPRIGKEDEGAWALLWAGVFLLAMFLFAQFSTIFEKPSASDYAIASVMTALAIHQFVDNQYEGPVVLIIVGMGFILYALLKGRAKEA